MENKLWADLQAQGTNLPEVVHHLFHQERARIEEAAAFLRNGKPIALVGVASAQYLCKPSVHYLNQHGVYASDWCASEAAYDMLPALRDVNVIINSRSGETAEVVKLSRALAEANIPYVAITNEPNSTVAQFARYTIWANTRKDDLVSINVVTGMMVATLALSAAIVGELDALYPQFQMMAEGMAGVVQRAIAQSSEIYSLFAGARTIYLLYRGASSGAAYCGRLVLEEVARQSGVAMGAAEFRQGPNEVIDENFAGVVFVPAGTQGLLNQKLAADIQRCGGRVMVIGNVSALISGRPTELIFSLPEIHESLRPVFEIVPVQVLAYELAKAQGYEPGQVRYISKVILTEDGIPNQTVPLA